MAGFATSRRRRKKEGHEEGKLPLSISKTKGDQRGPYEQRRAPFFIWEGAYQGHKKPKWKEAPCRGAAAPGKQKQPDCGCIKEKPIGPPGPDGRAYISILNKPNPKRKKSQMKKKENRLLKKGRERALSDMAKVDGVRRDGATIKEERGGKTTNHNPRSPTEKEGRTQRGR